MSRIYEALQKAESERKSAAQFPEQPPAELEVVSKLEEPAPVELGFHAEDVPAHAWNPSLLSLPALADSGQCVEQFRSLRSHLYLSRLQSDLKTILVSSGMPGEGKSFIAANLAISLARNNDCRVLLVDGDLRRPTLHNLLGAQNDLGLTDYLGGKATLAQVMQRYGASKGFENHGLRDLPNLFFLPAGDAGDNSLEQVSGHRMEEIVDHVSSVFDWILIDSPPVLAVTDAVDLARASDAVLLVARGESTPFDVAQRAQAAFSNSRILGFVLNAVKHPPKGSSYYSYYGSQAGDENQRRKAKRNQE